MLLKAIISFLSFQCKLVPHTALSTNQPSAYITCDIIFLITTPKQCLCVSLCLPYSTLVTGPLTHPLTLTFSCKISHRLAYVANWASKYQKVDVVWRNYVSDLYITAVKNVIQTFRLRTSYLLFFHIKNLYDFFRISWSKWPFWRHITHVKG